MNPIPQLEPMIKKLRLSGITDTLSKRNKEAIEKKMSYLDFLSLILNDEVSRREQNSYQTRVRRAGFNTSKTFESFDFNAAPYFDEQKIMNLAKGCYLEQKAPILIAGPCGTGKSHLAQALGHCAVTQGLDVMYATQTQLMTKMHSAKATNSYERRFAAYAKVPLLIIDDFGLKPLDPPYDEYFHDLIAQRYERAATIITSNLDFVEWGAAFPNRLLGAATIDRLRHGAYRIVLDGDTLRRPREY